MIKREKMNLIQTESVKGSHGLLTYASNSCFGGTTPCPKVIIKKGGEKCKRKMQKTKQKITRAGGKGLILQGSCLNYNLERYSCFVENVNILGSLVDSSLVIETRQGCLCVCIYVCATNNYPSVLGCVTFVLHMCTCVYAFVCS